MLVHVGGLLHSESKEEPLANPTLATLHLTLNPAWAQGFLHLVDSVLCGHMSTFFAAMVSSLPGMTPMMPSPGIFLLLFRFPADLPPNQARENLLFCSGTPLRYTLYLGFSVDLEVL